MVPTVPSEFVIVVEPAPQAEAKMAFELWLANHPEVSEKINPDDIMIDVMCNRRGPCEVRYKIRRSLLDARD